MGFIIGWLWYLAAFLAGSLTAWLIAAVAIRRTTRDEALSELAAACRAGGR